MVFTVLGAVAELERSLIVERAWNALLDCRRNGMHQHEAEQVALPSILLPSEQEEEPE